MVNTGQTLVNVYVQSSGAQETVYTVPAGKTFFLFGISTSYGAASLATFYANDGTTGRTSVRNTTNQVHATTISSVPIAQWAAGEAVKVTATASMVYNFWGVIV